MGKSGKLCRLPGFDKQKKLAKAGPPAPSSSCTVWPSAPKPQGAVQKPQPVKMKVASRHKSGGNKSFGGKKCKM